MVDSNKPLRLGTRGSLLAKTQSQWVADELTRLHPGLLVELHVVKTTGDRIQDRQLHDIGGKGLFTKELEQSLLAGETDLAVHSYKDVPVTMPLVDVSGLLIAATPKREDARDVLVAVAKSVESLPAGARVGTGSLRRQVQLLAIRPDLVVVPIRGNIDTRLRKQREGEVDAVVLAAAGLLRAGLFDAEMMSMIPPGQMVPAAGQGALAVQCRRDDARVTALLRAMDDAETTACVLAERAVILRLNADCHSPVGVHCRRETGGVRMTGVLPGRDGLLRKSVDGSVGGESQMAVELAAVLAGLRPS